MQACREGGLVAKVTRQPQKRSGKPARNAVAYDPCALVSAPVVDQENPKRRNSLPRANFLAEYPGKFRKEAFEDELLVIERDDDLKVDWCTSPGVEVRNGCTHSSGV
jgi:hypothetical protein